MEGLTPKQTDRLTVGRNITLILTWSCSAVESRYHATTSED
jgi:hypothetical protein